MHHFCSHAVAQVIGLQDFGDKCFCSVACYDPSQGDDHGGEPEIEEQPSTVQQSVASGSSQDMQNAKSTREVEWIHDRKYNGKKRQYLVKWRGQPDSTWEKVADLEDYHVQTSQYDFRANNLGKSRARAPSRDDERADELQCHLCGCQGELERQCDKCGNHMHQRCSDQIAALVGLPDFEEECFCSPVCYDTYVMNELVAFSPDDEEWGYVKTKSKAKAKVDEETKGESDEDSADKTPTKSKTLNRKKKYPNVGASFLVGRICRRKKKKLPGEAGAAVSGSTGPRYEVRWLETAFNAKVEYLDSLTLARGRKNYQLLDLDVISDDDEDDDEVTSKNVRYDPLQTPPVSLEEVELLQSMNFDPTASMDAPADLFVRDDGSTETRVKDRYKQVFQSSATASFFAYLPLSFWEEVVVHTNAYQRDLGTSYGGYGVQKPFTIEDMMTFLGILFYMKLFPRGEYRNFWGSQQENEVLQAGRNANLDHVMPLKRFKALRAALCFNHGVSMEDLGRDPVAKIRPLVNILKKTGSRYIDIGRDIAIDESTISCRTRYARRLICFNPRKPGGKFHFKIYMACCATSWIALNYKLYTKDSQMEYRLGGVIPAEEILSFKEDLQHCSKTRADVMEVLRPYFGTKRIVSTDNYYTSMMLLEGMKLKGLYGRGTVKSGSKHFPKHVMLTKGDKCARGDYRIGVCAANQSLAASWWDGNAVTIISNADSSDVTRVSRAVRMEKSSFQAPVCIKEYNQKMQGVDRLDQMRKRFSIADGHSFRKWHKVLGMGFIDIARCNAYLTRKMACGPSKSRDPHRDFMVELTTQLLSGEWRQLAPDDSLYADDAEPTAPLFSPDASKVARIPKSPTCKFISSKEWSSLPDQHGENRAKSWKARQCVVCKYEGKKHASVVTQYCLEHKVCLCSDVHPVPAPKEDFFCSNQDWSCWKKFHAFYLPKQVFNMNGHIRKSSRLYQAKMKAARSPPPTASPARPHGEFMSMLTTPMEQLTAPTARRGLHL